MGDSGLKAMKLSSQDKTQVVLEACDLVEHRKSLDLALSEQERDSLVAETLATFLSRHDPASDRICVGLPGEMFLLRHIRLPKMDAKKLDAAMDLEVPRHFPVPPEELIWDYWELSDTTFTRAEGFAEAHGNGQGTAGALGGEHCGIALIGARRLPVMSFLRKFQTSGIRADVVQCNCLALHNYLVYDRFSTCEAGTTTTASFSLRPIAAFDLGSGTAHLVASTPGFVWFRSAAVGSERINRTLVQNLKLPHALAEQTKRNPALATSVADFYAAIGPVFDEIARELTTGLVAMRDAHGGMGPERILAVGGGIQVHGLLGRLQQAEVPLK